MVPRPQGDHHTHGLNTLPGLGMISSMDLMGRLYRGQKGGQGTWVVGGKALTQGWAGQQRSHWA